MISNIDVTLRDGGYRNNFNFDIPYAISHVQAMALSGVEWIEIGYRNGSFKPIPNIGVTGVSPNDYISKIHDAVPEAKLCVIAHPHNITHEDVNEMLCCGISMLRICANMGNIVEGAKLANYAKMKGLTVSINLTRVSLLSPEEVLSLVAEVVNVKADIIYLADSNGSLKPNDITSLILMIKMVTDTEVGFHAHDNIGFAMANSIAAIKAGAAYIDSSLRGMGKGSGNLCLEYWLCYLAKEKLTNCYHLNKIFEQVNVLDEKDVTSSSSRIIADMILGLHDLTVEHRNNILACGNNIMLAYSKASKLHGACHG